MTCTKAAVEAAPKCAASDDAAQLPQGLESSSAIEMTPAIVAAAAEGDEMDGPLTLIGLWVTSSPAVLAARFGRARCGVQHLPEKLDVLLVAHADADHGAYVALQEGEA